MRNIASIPFYFCLLVMLMLSCASCGFMHKVFSKQKISVDSITMRMSDTASAKKFDSSRVKKADSTGVKKNEEINHSGIEIEFNDTTGSKVTVEGDKITVEGKIKSIKKRSSNNKSSVDSSHTSASDSGHVAKTDTSHRTDASASVVSKKEKVVQKNNTSFRPPWYAYLIGLLFTLVILLLAWRKYKKKLLDVFNSIHS